MCGIAGILRGNFVKKDLLAQEAISISESLKSRGPDSSGYWIDSELGLSFAHRRLSIQDLSSKGNQPFVSHSGRYVIIYNGEIYNHNSLRKELSKTSQKNYKWSSNSDTETLLACIEEWGLQLSLNKFVGMFAFALWDKRKRSLYLVRDRFGEKPLYFGERKINYSEKKSFVFASDLSALREIQGFNIELNRSAIASFFNQGFISSPLSIEDGIYQLNPGHYLEISLKNIEESNFSKLEEKQWYNICDISFESSQYKDSNEEELLEILKNSLLTSIEEKAISDVPLGVFLSGGIDSSLICCLLQSRSRKPIDTFTITFPDNNQGEKGFNEGPYAKSIAEYIGTNHNEISLSSNDLLNLVPDLTSIYSEPFADSSQIPTHLLCREVHKRDIKVALSGDGADELFGGYNRHIFIPRINRLLGKLPFEVRNFISNILFSLPYQKRGLSQQKIQKFANAVLKAKNPEEIYYVLTTQFNDLSEILKGYKSIGFNKNTKLPKANTIAESIMLADLQNYLHSDILVKTDRASMATSLEVRSPFLDHRIAETAWKLPLEMKIINNRSKLALRKILYEYIPNKLIDRPKSGFAIPINNWLSGPLKIWADDLLSYSLIERQGFINPSFVSKLWQSHLNGEKDNSSQLWTILMWQSWVSDLKI